MTGARNRSHLIADLYGTSHPPYLKTVAQEREDGLSAEALAARDAGGPWLVRIAGETTCNSAHTRDEVDQPVDVLTSTGHGAEVLASVNGKPTVIETYPAKEARP